MDVINSLNLGIKLIGYADDNTIISDGTVNGRQLKINLNYFLNLINYMVNKKHLIMEIPKQKYIVFDIDGNLNDNLHEKKYFDLSIGNNLLFNKNKLVKLLGIILIGN